MLTHLGGRNQPPLWSHNDSWSVAGEGVFLENLGHCELQNSCSESQNWWNEGDATNWKGIVSLCAGTSSGRTFNRIIREEMEKKQLPILISKMLFWLKNKLKKLVQCYQQSCWQFSVVLFSPLLSESAHRLLSCMPIFHSQTFVILQCYSNWFQLIQPCRNDVNVSNSLTV